MAFGLDTTIDCPLSAAGLEMQTLKNTPRKYSLAEAPDKCGQVVNRHLYGGDATIIEHEAEFSFQSGTAPTSLKIGAETMVDSLAIATSNSDWPKYTIKWRSGVKNPTGLTFTLALPAILPKRCAQEMGVAVTGDAKMNSCTLTFSCDYSEGIDKEGNQGCCSWTNGKAEISVEAVNVGTSGTFTAEEGWDVTDPANGESQSNTDYAKFETFKASKALTPDVEPAA